MISARRASTSRSMTASGIGRSAVNRIVPFKTEKPSSSVRTTSIAPSRQVRDGTDGRCSAVTDPVSGTMTGHGCAQVAVPGTPGEGGSWPDAVVAADSRKPAR